MLNGYSQLNIKGKINFIETSVVLVSVMLDFSHKKYAIIEIIKKILSLCCLYIVYLKIECEIIAI